MNGVQVFKMTMAALAVCFLTPSKVHAADKPARPNIVVILSDDMGYCDLGCYGSEIQTPNLDMLAKNGLRFTQFYNTARCCPTRASLMSGLYPHQAGVGHMIDGHKGLDGYLGDLNDRCVAIPQVLKTAGYNTYMLGKWHVSKNTLPDSPNYNWPMQRGFEHYYGTLQGAGSFFDPGTLMRDNQFISCFNDPEYKPQTYYYTDALSDHACKYIDQQKSTNPDKPFFMYVAYTAAHWPMHALEKDIAKYKGKYDGGYEPIRKARFEKMKSLGLIHRQWELSPMAGDWDKVKNKEWESRCMEVYAAMIDNMDQGIGRIIDTLRKNGQYDNTLIMFMQDNGGNAEEVGRPGNEKRPDAPTLPKLGPEHINLSGRPKQTREGWPVLGGTGVMPGGPETFIAYGKNWGNVSNTPFREYKHWVHEGGIATPMIAHWPNGITRKNELEKQPGHLIDIMATCVDLSQATYPKEFNSKPITPMEGKSLVPAFNGKPVERDIYWEHEGNRAVRAGDWKLVAKGPEGKWELYNLAVDRTEMHDLSSSETDKYNDLKSRWETWAKRAHVLPWPWKGEYGSPAGKAIKTQATPGKDQKQFLLKPDSDLSGSSAPSVKDSPVSIEVAISKMGTDGVLLAQGGSSAGYALYLKDSKLIFALRSKNKLHTVESRDALPATTKNIVAKLSGNGNVELLADSKTVATGNVQGLLEKQPQDGLQVGQDTNGTVGDYAAPNKFNGEIASAKLDLSGK